jgi:hypothetical protein
VVGLPMTHLCEDVADILGNSPEIIRKHYARWSSALLLIATIVSSIVQR